MFKIKDEYDADFSQEIRLKFLQQLEDGTNKIISRILQPEFPPHLEKSLFRITMGIGLNFKDTFKFNSLDIALKIHLNQ